MLFVYVRSEAQDFVVRKLRDSVKGSIKKVVPREEEEEVYNNKLWERAMTKSETNLKAKIGKPSQYTTG